jgi:hypothetical protein
VANALAAQIDLPVGFDAAQLELVESPDGLIYSLPGMENLRATGAPALPYTTWRVLLPQGKTLSRVELVKAKWKRVSGPSNLAHAKKLVSDQGNAVSVSMDGLREDWSDGGIFPSAAARGQGFSVMEGYRLGSVDIFPMRVLANGAVEILQSGELNLELADQAMDDVAEREIAWPGVAERAAARVRQLVVNPGQVSAYAPPAGILPELLKSSSTKAPSPLAEDEVFAGGRVDYVIVTIPSLVSEFQRLADDHIAHGLRTKVVTTDWILANYRHGVDLQETIRNFLREAYAKWGLHYVLLGGDAGMLPPRYVRSTFYPSGGHTDIPADLYFGALDGNWNANGNGIFGEAYQSFLDPGDYQDMIAEVVVGRAPVNDLLEATTFVDKCLEYQTPTSNGAYLGKALFLSEVLFPSDWDGMQTINLDGATYSENIIFNSLITPGNLIDSERLYENYTAFPYTLQETQQAALDSMSTGHFGLVNHVGHGFYYNMSVGDANIFAGDALGLANAPNYFVINALNCSSGAFDFDCLLETYIQHSGGGSVASLGASREAFPSTANDYQQEFFRQIFVLGNTRLGDAMNASRDKFTPPSLNSEEFKRWTHFCYTLLGDPALRMWRKPPVTPLVTKPSSVPLGTSQITVGVSDTGLPVPAARVTLHKPGEVWATGVTDTLTGQVTIDFQPLTQGTIDVVVDGASLQPQFQTITVAGAAAANIVGSPLSIDDGGGGNGLADSGESIDWYFHFENNGNGSFAGGVDAVLRPVDATGATVTDSTITVGDLAGSATADPGDPVSIDLSPSIADGTTLSFDLVSTSGPNTWTQRVYLKVIAPEPEVVRVFSDDSVTGNNDGIPQPGEVVELHVEVKNYGAGQLEGLSATLSSSSPNVTISQASDTWPDLGVKANAYGTTNFQVAESDTSMENWLIMILSDAKGHFWSHRFELREPDPPTGVVPFTNLGPTTIALQWNGSTASHLMGYRVYRSDTQGGPYAEITQDVVLRSGFFRDDGLATLTRYYYEVATVDSSGVEGPRTSEVTASTGPPEIGNAFPLPTNATVEGGLAVGDLRADGVQFAVLGGNLVYALDAHANELLDGDGNAQTLGPINNLGSDFTFAGITLANLDGNPGLEILAGDWFGKTAYVLDTSGNPLPGWPQNTGAQNWASFSVGDLDGDLQPEIVTNTVTGRTYAWHVDGSEVLDGDSNGSTNGVFAVRIGEIYNRSTISLYDLDQDGGREMIFGTNWRDGTTDNMVHAYKYDGTEAPGWPKNLGPNGYNATTVTIADLDRDGTVELIFPCENDSLYIWEPDGSNYMNFPIHFSSNSDDLDGKTPSIAVGNLDGDPELEMVGVSVLSRTNVSIYVFEHDGMVKNGWPQSVAAFSRSSPIVGDIDGDGVPDIIFASGGEDIPDNLYAFKADGSTMAGFPISLSGSPWGTPLLTDFDGDGDVDLLLAGYDNLLHAWDLPGAYDPTLLPWPTFQGNYKRTGVYQDPTATGVETQGSTPASRLVLRQNVPNPFNPSTVINFDVPSELNEAMSRVTIYDLAGRRVRTLLAQPLPAGHHEIRWNGRDASGRSVASGVYFTRLEVGSEVRSLKMTLAK